MSKIFELYGYRLDQWSEEAIANREKAWCPFMNSECDGGGNRYSSSLRVDSNPNLSEFFPGKKIVQSGVCSLQLKESDQPWIVCPRRLLSLKGNSPNYQKKVREKLAEYSNLKRGTQYRSWSEVKMKVPTVNDKEESKNFDYTFDYIIAGSKKIQISEVAEIINGGVSEAKRIAEKNNYTLAYRNGEIWVEDFPSEPITIVEVMTSSTSGGDKKKRTQIAMACEDAIISPEKHNGPGINYRQVWARMVSQLIVKSQVGKAWNGKTIWLLQDRLAQYISSSTALDLSKFISNQTDEVNILAFGYGDIKSPQNDSIKELTDCTLYSGPISANESNLSNDGFIEIVKIGASPDKNHLWRSLFKKKPSGYISWQ